MFSFVNMDDAALDRLSGAVHNEQVRRIVANISKLPVPVLTGNNVQDVIAYRDKHGGSLLQAKLVIDHHKSNNAKLMSP